MVATALLQNLEKCDHFCCFTGKFNLIVTGKFLYRPIAVKFRKCNQTSKPQTVYI